MRNIEWGELQKIPLIFSIIGKLALSLRLGNRSRMSREVHVRCCEQLGGKFPGLTLLVLGFENPKDVDRVLKVLQKRFEKYKLELHAEKTRVINLKSKRGEGSRSFDFLGFTHYLGKSRNGKLVLKRKTSSKKLTIALCKAYDWIKHNRHRKLKELIAELNAKLRGHYNYYGMTFNDKGISQYYFQVKRSLHKWLNRRGGKAVWSWERFTKLTDEWMPLLKPKIYRSYLKANPS